MKYTRHEPPKIKRLAWRLGVLETTFFFRVNNNPFTIETPFYFDGATIPLLFWWIATPFARWVVEAALVHDYLYRCYMLRETWLWEHGTFRPTTRWERDRVFLAILRMNAQQTKSRTRRARLLWRAHAMYLAVRKFGDSFQGEGVGELPGNIKRKIKM